MHCFVIVFQLCFILINASPFEKEHAHETLKRTHYEEDGTHNPEYDHEVLMGASNLLITISAC